MDLLDVDLIAPILASIAAGGAIGAEREYRGAPAGFRTHILVALSSTLLMLAAVHQVRWLSDTPQDLVRIDPVRMAHGVLTGIGFLCGGVIFREGFNIVGLTTAASLWTTSALGVLFGVGFYALALVGTVATLAVLAAITVSENLLPQRRYIELTVRYARAAEQTSETFRTLLARYGLKPLSVSSSADGAMVEFCATVSEVGLAKTDALAATLAADPAVQGFEVSARG
jgi:putative Mg2+ transporter-C (MgtC) family protein